MLEDLIKQSFRKFDQFDPSPIISELQKSVNKNLVGASGAIDDVLDKEGTGYYQFLPVFLEVLKPTQIVELGGAMGVGDICMLHSPYQDFKLYSITLAEHGLEFSYIDKDKYPNFIPIVGDDLDLSNWPKDLDLSKTDLWFIDSLHEENHLRKELELYKPFFKEGTIVLFDDMFLNPGMTNVYYDLENIFPMRDKIVNSTLHWTGFTLVEVGEK